jgi:hypothetical protein
VAAAIELRDPLLDADETGRLVRGMREAEVEKICPDLVVRDAKRDTHSVRYEAVNVMLLNESLKEHQRVREQARENENQDIKIQELARKLGEQQQQINELRDQLAELRRRLVERVARDIN